MKFFILVLIVLGTLALLNPDEANFATYIGERVQTVAADNARNTSGGLLEPSVRRGVQTLSASAFERNSYAILSTYTHDSNGSQPKGAWKFLGIGGQFIELETPDEQGG